MQEAHEQIIAARYPFYHDGLRSLARTDGPLSIAAARLSELLPVLAESPGVRLTVGLPDRLRGELGAGLESLPGVKLLPDEEAQPSARRADVVHRLASIRGLEDMRHLRMLGERVVITAEDLPRYDNPADFSDFPRGISAVP